LRERFHRTTIADSCWLRGLWPVTVEADWQIPGGLAASLRSWTERCRVDSSGLDALFDLVN